MLSIEEEAVIVAFRKYTLLPLDDCLYAFYWRAPIGWSGLIVSALWASGLSGRCFPAQVDDIPMRCAA